MEKNSPSSDYFPKTRWSLVLTAQKGEEVHAHKALSELFEQYWYPLYSYVRRRGYSKHDAEDLTQAFFESLVRKDSLRTVDASLGKLRAFLLTSVKNFLINQHRIDTAAKRGGINVQRISTDEAEAKLEGEIADHDSPDVLFERAWARTLLEEVMAKLKEVYRELGKSKQFDLFLPYLHSGDTPDYRALSLEVGGSGVSLRVQFHRLKQRYGDLLKEAIRHTVATEEEAAEEREFLLKCLS